MASDLQIRPATENDFSVVLSIVATQFMCDFQGMPYGAENLKRRWQALNLETDSWLALKGDTAVAYIDLLSERSCPMLYLADSADADVGFQLLQLAEKSADGNTLTAQISDSNAILKQIYTQADYASDLTFNNMEIVLDGQPPAPNWPDGIEVRPYYPSTDAHATYLVDEEAAEDKGYHSPLTFLEWQQRMRLDRDDFDPSWWFLAWAGQEIAGVSLGLTIGATGWVDHLGVKRPYRRQGLGKALLLHSFAQFYQRGIHKIMLNVDSGSLTNAPCLYESVGMKTVQSYHVYQKEVL